MTNLKKPLVKDLNQLQGSLLLREHEALQRFYRLRKNEKNQRNDTSHSIIIMYFIIVLPSFECKREHQ